MKYLLDSNTCIRYLKGQPPSLLLKFQQIPAADIAVCSIVKSELYGALKSNNPEKALAVQKEFLKIMFHYPLMIPLWIFVLKFVLNWIVRANLLDLTTCLLRQLPWQTI